MTHNRGLARRQRIGTALSVAALTCRLSCHSHPRLRFAYLQRESQGRFAPCAKQQFAAGQRLCKRNRRFPFWGKRLPACQKSLAEFAARRRQRDFDHFLSGRVPDRKYNSGCKCAICTPLAYKSCARQTAILLSKRAKPFFDSLTGAFLFGESACFFMLFGSFRRGA